MAEPERAVADYVAEVARLAKTGKTTERSFRGVLASLIDALAPGLKAVNEPKRTDCGAPDYIVQDRTGLAVFYVEAKDLGDGDLDGKKRTGHKEQFDRYKAAPDTIIFTDYLDFYLYRRGQLVSAARIADWDGESKVSGTSGAYGDLAALVADAAAGGPQGIDGAKRLAELMAGKARLLQRNALTYLERVGEAAVAPRPPDRDPMLHFYEDFLAAYDAGLRKERGVWYTPIQVVRFIVAAADWALRTRFALPDGLADSSKVDIECEEIAPSGKKMSRKVKKTVHRVQLLDPALGTGTFLAEAVRQIFAKFSGNEGLWPGYVENDLLPRLNGFELLMASYTMAHVKLDFALRESFLTGLTGFTGLSESEGGPRLSRPENLDNENPDNLVNPVKENSASLRWKQHRVIDVSPDRRE